MRLMIRTSCGECWGKSRRLRAKRSVAERLRLTPRYLGPLDDKIKIAKELTVAGSRG